MGEPVALDRYSMFSRMDFRLAVTPRRKASFVDSFRGNWRVGLSQRSERTSNGVETRL